MMPIVAFLFFDLMAASRPTVYITWSKPRLLSTLLLAGFFLVAQSTDRTLSCETARIISGRSRRWGKKATHPRRAIAILASFGNGIGLDACSDTVEQTLVKFDHRLWLVEDRSAAAHFGQNMWSHPT